MWNRMSRQTDGLACLGMIFIAIALTACETAPGIAAPTVSEEIADISSLAEGATREVDLSKAFKGEKLAFSVRSDDLGVAIPTIAADNRNIVITAIGPGTATITVTATNSGGNASQSFKVTVPQPQQQTPPPPSQQPPPPQPPTTTEHSNCPSPLEITRGGNKKCTLTEGHALVYSVPAGEQPRIKVRKPDRSATKNVWTITALLKGRPVVHIRDEIGNTVDEITVAVPNITPRLIEPDEEIEGALADHPDETGLHTATLTGIASAFTDDDDVDKSKVDPIGNGIFNYKVQYKPNELLIKTVGGFLLTENSPKTTHDIEAVVLKPFMEDFTIEIYAYDPDNGRSDSPVKVKFTASDTPVNPRTGTYDVKQKDNGDFDAVRIGNRLDIKHRLSFKNAAGDFDAPFEFAEDFNDDLIEKISGKSYLAVPPDGTIDLCDKNEVPKMFDSIDSIGSACYTHTSTDKVIVGDADGDFVADGAPSIKFQLPSERNGLNSGSATITIKYHVWAYSQRQDHNAIIPSAAKKIHTDSESLRLNIHKCVVTTDCPISSDS